jgi:DNA-3-methyladenine glycosylase II
VQRLTQRSLRAAAAELAANDPDLAASLDRNGPPPLWAREPSYATLVHLILEQQVSLASAQAAFDKLVATLGGDITPPAFLKLDDAALRAIGFSRQKAGYARDLATAVTDGFDLGGLTRLTDDDVRAALQTHRGIGRWTSDIYLTMCLLRPDVWPHGDLALATSAREVLALDERPTFPKLEAIAERWHPYRAVAARMLWHDYLQRRGLPVGR